jgi:hypothetical protein
MAKRLDMLTVSLSAHDPKPTFRLMHVKYLVSLKRILSCPWMQGGEHRVFDTSYGGYWRCLYAVVTECRGARSFGR